MRFSKMHGLGNDFLIFEDDGIRTGLECAGG